VARIAATSAVMSIAAGHHVTQRPQPTHPDEPNWSHHDASLWVVHWRYRAAVVPRTLPPARCECSLVKHESHTRARSAEPSRRSVESSTEVQKQVGQTIVQLLQARHRSATLVHCGCWALA
jgi:hypothetical protein